MLKHSQKRYQYNTNPTCSNEKDRYKPKYHNNTLVHDYPISSTTPIQKGYVDDRHRINSSMNSTNQYYQPPYRHQQDHYQPRKRVSSATNVKRTEDKISVAKKRNVPYQQNFKNTKKVYFGQSYNQDFQPQSYNHQKSSKTNHVQRRSKQPQNALQENINHLNNKDRNRDYINYRNELKGYQASVEINQKQIFDKIGRINRINQEINSRLANMLNKIDNA